MSYACKYIPCMFLTKILCKYCKFVISKTNKLLKNVRNMCLFYFIYFSAKLFYPIQADLYLNLNIFIMTFGTKKQKKKSD